MIFFSFKIEVFIRKILNKNWGVYIGVCVFSIFVIFFFIVVFSKMVCRNIEVMFFIRGV